MIPSFRQSMDWFHTWIGVVLGALLFAIFWMGTLSVFDKEIDRWMKPMTRVSSTAQPLSLDSLRASYDLAVAAGSRNWSVTLPSERNPVLRVSYTDKSGRVQWDIDPSTGAVLPDPGTWAGSEFIYPFHYDLHLHFKSIGVWLVGLAGMMMMALCVSGLIVHRKLFADFFTFRPKKNPRRVILDVHNLTGVLGLPFHLLITLSGLVIFYSVYFPSGWQASFDNRGAFNRDAFAFYNRPRANQPSAMTSLDGMARQAQHLWDGEGPRSLFVSNPGDAAAFVTMSRPIQGITHFPDAVVFDAASGEVLHQRVGLRPINTAQRFIAGLHLIQFKHWTLRWIYFVLGLAGCAMIATGYLFWVEARRKRHEKAGLVGVRLVDGLAVGSMAGIIVATLAFFVSNRLLPLDASFLGFERASLEVLVFFVMWIAAFAHAWCRPGLAWIEQCQSIVILAVAAVALNWITTGDHLVRSLTSSRLWPVAGMDVLLALSAFVSFLTARALKGRKNAKPEIEYMENINGHA